MNYKKYEAVSNQLKNAGFSIPKVGNSYNVKYKDVLFVRGVPDELLAEKIAREISATCARLADQIDGYIALIRQSAEQISLNLFGGSSGITETVDLGYRLGAPNDASGAGATTGTANGVRDGNPGDAENLDQDSAGLGEQQPVQVDVLDGAPATDCQRADTGERPEQDAGN